ncbi:hypothetical protein [Xenococcus sp. PCC 7305]|uniref:hypothetical protein n=1 Tax=Xenococcus sp. PCC 7305 TaxID=102125 RepID=UPI00031BA16C|nr:hypothetical protein [Xenococcus sp. PCC 7305]
MIFHQFSQLILIQATSASFAHFSKVGTLSSSQPFDNPLHNISALNQAISDRLLQIDHADNLSTEINSDEIKRVSASIYGLRAIASELNELAGTDLRF